RRQVWLPRKASAPSAARSARKPASRVEPLFIPAITILIRVRHSAYLAHKFQQRVVELIHHALLERDDGIVGDLDLFRTDLSAALGDIAVTDSKFVLQQFGAIDIIERVHLQPGYADKKARATELLFLVMIAHHVADVLAQKALDALAELLHPVLV